ncbi:MAG: bifunctional (p)ppGpp synthetase/guanosine-3',5'-bis(diphosphate) 3'-pyrophosphohydrolase [candidate division Zixibacteria bacterium]|nr:bifunctional (p)ppGpp synthetase/guanosine-3',5'-bis(diphosphate) 3'-pyrophosphohydrolase [candidate division Zixibacteria bacterium]
MNLAEFIIEVEAQNANVNIPLIRRAFEFSSKAHEGQSRDSGAPYMEHCLAVAHILAEWHMDSATIAAGLLHDVIEDTEVGIDYLTKEFGSEIAQLVDGATKISLIKVRSREEQQMDFFRKMLLSMARDIRVILIKLADRVHNMQTLDCLPRERQLRIAQETRDIYAPLANRFGIAKARIILEDLSLKYLEPEVFKELANRLDETREEREKFIASVVGPIKEALSKEKIKSNVYGRAKHLDSINRKIKVRGVPFEEMYDLSAIRIIVSSVHECYHTLGTLHSLWKPVPERFHDYIANPKPNGYQSLHTTVVGPNGKPIEIQIRTKRMHYVAENGIAAHWLYKEGKQSFDRGDKQMMWLKDVLEWQKEMNEPSEFLEYLKVDLFAEDIYVFTPKGTIIHLPRGATPLDFAYAVHTEVGARCSGARINNRIAPLSTTLKSGDIIDIMTNPNKRPSQDWLKLVVTSRARTKIKRWLKQSGHDRLVNLGKELLTRELQRLKLDSPSDQELEDIAQRVSLKSIDALYASIGNGDISPTQVVSKLSPQPGRQSLSDKNVQELVRKSRESHGLKIQGHSNMMFRFAGCCQPVPGEEVIGFITRGRGVTLHRSDCSNLSDLMREPERQVEVTWDVAPGQSFLVRIEIVVIDRKNILRDITQVVSDSDSNLRGAEMQASETTATGYFAVEINNLAHLERLFLRLRKVPGVISVERSREQGQDHSD